MSTIFNISREKKQAHTMSYLHNHVYYELYFQLAGERHYFCNNKYYKLSRNSLVVISPHILHKFEGGPYERVLLIVPKDFFPTLQHTYLDKLHEAGAIQFNDEDMVEIQKILNELLHLNSTITKDNQLQLSLTFSTLLYKLYYADSTTLYSTHTLKQDTLNYQLSTSILKIMDYVKKHYKEPITYNDLCRHFNLSKAWIAKGFLQANGLTVFQYKLALQLNEAQQLLRTTTLPVEKIAERLGFSSVNYFCKVFKAHLSLTPLQFRKSRINILK